MGIHRPSLECIKSQGYLLDGRVSYRNEKGRVVGEKEWKSKQTNRNKNRMTERTG